MDSNRVRRSYHCCASRIRGLHSDRWVTRRVFLPFPGHLTTFPPYRVLRCAGRILFGHRGFHCLDDYRGRLGTTLGWLQFDTDSLPTSGHHGCNSCWVTDAQLHEVRTWPYVVVGNDAPDLDEHLETATRMGPPTTHHRCWLNHYLRRCDSPLGSGTINWNTRWRVPTVWRSASRPVCCHFRFDDARLFARCCALDIQALVHNAKSLRPIKI